MHLEQSVAPRCSEDVHLVRVRINVRFRVGVKVRVRVWGQG